MVPDVDPLRVGSFDNDDVVTQLSHVDEGIVFPNMTNSQRFFGNRRKRLSIRDQSPIREKTTFVIIIEPTLT